MIGVGHLLDKCEHSSRVAWLLAVHVCCLPCSEQQSWRSPHRPIGDACRSWLTGNAEHAAGCSTFLGTQLPYYSLCACLQTIAAVLELCNALVIKSAGVLESLCMVGVVHLAARFASPSWQKPVRLQAALFLQAACTHSPATAQMLIACQVGSASSIEHLC